MLTAQQAREILEKSNKTSLEQILLYIEDTSARGNDFTFYKASGVSNETVAELRNLGYSVTIVNESYKITW